MNDGLTTQRYKKSLRYAKEMTIFFINDNYDNLDNFSASVAANSDMFVAHKCCLSCLCCR